MRFELDFDERFHAKFRRECFFTGIGEAIAIAAAAAESASAAGAGAIAGGATALGIGAETAGVIGTVGVGALEGAALGAGTSALTGGSPLKGAEYGALGGGALAGAGAALGGVTGATSAAGASAAGTAAPAGIAAAPDATAAAADLTGATAPLAPVTTATLAPASQSLDSLESGSLASTTGATATGGGSLPGSVGAGAATGVPSAASGINVPTSIQAPTPDTDLIGAGGTNAPTTGPASNLAPSAPPSTSLAPSTPASVTPTGGVAPPAGPTGVGELANVPAYSGPSVPGVTNLSSTQQFLNNPGFGTAAGIIEANPTTALSVGAMGYEAIKGMQPPPYAGQIAAEAKSATAQGSQLESYVNSGQLPPGLQQQVNTAAESAKASIRSSYASRGMSGSSAEQEDLGRVDQTMVAQGADMALKLYNAGVSQSQLGEELYGQLMNVAIQQDQALSSAIGNFAFAMAGGQKPLTPAAPAGG